MYSDKFKITQSHLFNSSRQAGIVCTDYFKVIIFLEKQFVKNGSFMNFWFVGSRK